ncbi:MAG TPA: hypothetical protein VF647_22860 [Longimicrobium sp.]|jgi:pimeloyl-ACP methyl ester carboxylesterase
MNSLLNAAAVLLLSITAVVTGCTPALIRGAPVAEPRSVKLTSPDSSNSAPYTSFVPSSAERGVLLHGAQLADLAYLDVDSALGAFRTLGYDAAYFASRDLLREHYPRVFVLGEANQSRVTLVFVGTETWFDWLQNVKITRYVDVPGNGTFYVPPGHGGFRRGQLNLIADGFYSRILPDLLKEWGFPETGPISVRLVGHSLGAALAILAAPIVEGVRFENEVGSTVPAIPNLQAKTSRFRVSNIILFAAPYALSTEPLRQFPREKFDPYQAYKEAYGDLILSVVRDDDPVPRLGNPSASFRYRHVGKHYRITRDDVLLYEETSWQVKEPHGIKSYIRGLQVK